MRHEVKVSLAEEAELQRRADAAGVTVVRWMVEAALGDTSNQRKASNTVRKGLLAQLNSISNNVNRLTIQAKANDRTPAEFIGLLTTWQEQTREAIAGLRAEQD